MLLHLLVETVDYSMLHKHIRFSVNKKIDSVIGNTRVFQYFIYKMEKPTEEVTVLASEIDSIKSQIVFLKKQLQQKTLLLESICTHVKYITEYDDDFNNPHYYKYCCTCKQYL